MSAKVFRDPLYNYIAIDRDRDHWLIDLLDSPEVQRLRRIHQLGVTDYTYPGAGHTRFSHTLGVLHLMLQAHQYLERSRDEEHVRLARAPLLAAAVLHDVGHGPFSHLFEPCLGIDHEEWSVRIVRDENTQVHRVLRSVDSFLPESVAGLIEDGNDDRPRWQKFLLSSQLDVDRIDYLRRDSLFTGAGYGAFDWYRIINTIEFNETAGRLDIVWPAKAMLAIEEYIFARFYMYQNVYLHKTTRGFEAMIKQMWARAKRLHQDGANVDLEPAIADYWNADQPDVEQFLRLEEFTVLRQIQRWQDNEDRVLSDLARRFLNRDRFAMIEPPNFADELEDRQTEWESALREVVMKAGYEPAVDYCLRDKLAAKYYRPYKPERQSDEQIAATNAINIMQDGEQVEISELLPRLQPITREPADQYRYYVPPDVRAEAEQLRKRWWRAT